MNYEIKDLTFKQTCSACPEQYDVFDKDDKQVAYIRLRWGSLYVECPDVGGETVYEASIGDGFAGCFRSENERRMHLYRIAAAVKEWMNKPDEDDEDEEEEEDIHGV